MNWNSETLLQIASKHGIEKAVDVADGESLFTQSERVSNIEGLDVLEGYDMPSVEDVSDERAAHKVVVKLGKLAPAIQMQIASATDECKRESLIVILDAIVETANYINSYISRPGEASRLKSIESLGNLLGLMNMSRDINSVVKTVSK